jgi:hypothetical protein
MGGCNVNAGAFNVWKETNIAVIFIFWGYLRSIFVNRDFQQWKKSGLIHWFGQNKTVKAFLGYVLRSFITH